MRSRWGGAPVLQGAASWDAVIKGDCGYSEDQNQLVETDRRFSNEKLLKITGRATALNKSDIYNVQNRSNSQQDNSKIQLVMIRGKHLVAVTVQ